MHTSYLLVPLFLFACSNDDADNGLAGASGLDRVPVPDAGRNEAATAADGAAATVPEDLIFAAIEADGTLARLSGVTGELLGVVDLASFAHGSALRYDIHNVQGAPDGKVVWMTAMPTAEGAEDHGNLPMPEQLIGVDAQTLEIRDRIELGEELHAAHVVITKQTAFVTAYEADAVIVVDLANAEVSRTITLPEGTGPHGARLTPDGAQLVVAGFADGSVHVIDTGADRVDSYDLPSRAVQTAVLPDGSAAFVTLYDSRQVARLGLEARDITLFDLPADAAGPVQIYPTPDGSRIWVADQGLLDDEPAGNSLYALDSTTGALLLRATVSPGPHGVVVNHDGSRVWTTTLVENTVQSVDATTADVLSTTQVGDEPNGITCVHRTGSMP